MWLSLSRHVGRLLHGRPDPSFPRLHMGTRTSLAICSRLDNRAPSRLADCIMARETQRFWLTFDGESSRKPLIWEMSKKFEVIFNVRNASVTPTVGIIALELEGDREEIKKAVTWFEANGVQVEPVEINTIEG